MDEGKPYGGQWNYDQKNPRVGMMYRVWDRMESREKKQVLKQADAYLKNLNRL
jgi:deoxyribodipyrimidine photolyase-related protein